MGACLLGSMCTTGDREPLSGAPCPHRPEYCMLLSWCWYGMGQALLLCTQRMIKKSIHCAHVCCKDFFHWAGIAHCATWLRVPFTLPLETLTLSKVPRQAHPYLGLIATSKRAAAVIMSTCEWAQWLHGKMVCMGKDLCSCPVDNNVRVLCVAHLNCIVLTRLETWRVLPLARLWYTAREL
jgi:hypothetical protein